MVKTKRSAQDVVYDVLAALPIGMALTSNEIYNELEPADQGIFVGGVAGIMKSIYKLNERGIVTNGNSEIVNGRTVKTWKLVNEVSTHKPVVVAAPEAVEREAEEVVEREQESRIDVVEDEIVKVYPAETLINDARSVFRSLTEASAKQAQFIEAICENRCDNFEKVDKLIDGLSEVNDLLNEKIAVKNIVPVIEFLRGLK